MVQWNHIVQVHMHITPRIEKVLMKSENVLICLDLWILDGLVKKKSFEPNKACFMGLYSKSVYAVGFSSK